MQGSSLFMPEKRASPRLNIRHVNPAVSGGSSLVKLFATI